MNPAIKIWLIFSLLGLLASIALVLIFEAFPVIRLFSNEAAVFGIMSATMSAAITYALKMAPQQQKE